MHEYDTVLKALLQDPRSSILKQITGAQTGRLLNVELPEVQQTRVDLLFEILEEIRRLVAIELQSANDPLLPLRMAEYSLRVYRIHKQFPEQYVLYVGNGPMTMPSALIGPDHVCRYKIIDIRLLDEEMLLDSPFAADNIIAILTHHKDRGETIRRILARIAKLEAGARDAAFSKLMILAGLRKLGASIRTEVKHMPILDDIMEHDVIGPAIRQGIQQGRREEVLKVLRGLIAKRFGPLPAWAEERFTNLPVDALEQLSLRILDTQSVDELFNP
jgi:predicted transposase YdaD